MKRIVEMSDLNPVIRTLLRIRKHLFNPENMRSDQIREQIWVAVACVFHSTHAWSVSGVPSTRLQRKWLTQQHSWRISWGQFLKTGSSIKLSEVT